MKFSEVCTNTQTIPGTPGTGCTCPREQDKLVYIISESCAVHRPKFPKVPWMGVFYCVERDKEDMRTHYYIKDINTQHLIQLNGYTDDPYKALRFASEASARTFIHNVLVNSDKYTIIQISTRNLETKKAPKIDYEKELDRIINIVGSLEPNQCISDRVFTVLDKQFMENQDLKAKLHKQSIELLILRDFKNDILKTTKAYALTIKDDVT
jgi:hypothetical protein